MDLYLIRMRESLKKDLEKVIEEKGPEIFGSREEFEKKRVLKNGRVSIDRVKSFPSLRNLEEFLHH